MKFAIISDIHIGEEEEFKGMVQKMSRHSLPFFNEFIEKMNNNVKPEFVVNLGDAINDIDREIDIKNLQLALKTLNKLECPVYNLVGNHEQRKIELEELEKIVNHKPLYYSSDISDYHLVVLFSDDYDKKGPIISEDQMKWLQKDLDNTTKQSIVFVHHSLADQDLAGNIWFEDKPERSLIHNRTDIRKVLENSRKVRAVFNGHLHWNKMNIHNQIPYFNIQSLVENFKREGQPSKTWAIVEITPKAINVDIQGADKQVYLHEVYS